MDYDEIKLKLKDGEYIKETSHKSKGGMAEIDIYEYDVFNQQDEKVGTIELIDGLTPKGRYIKVNRYDID